MGESRWGVSVLVADDQSLFRDALKAALETEGDLHVVAEAADGLRAVDEARRTRPHVAIVAAGLPPRGGVEATRLIKRSWPECRVVVLDSDESVEVLAAALQAGASGFLTKGCDLPTLIESVRAVNRGEVLVPPHMLGALLESLFRRREAQSEAAAMLARLSPREKDVLALLAKGLGKQAMGECLRISPETARTHIHNVLSKLGLHSKLEAAAFVIRNGILDDLLSPDVASMLGTFEGSAKRSHGDPLEPVGARPGPRSLGDSSRPAAVMPGPGSGRVRS
jgi:two-component system, NarL family, nitrate/nitrite response regulator NarL